MQDKQPKPLIKAVRYEGTRLWTCATPIPWYPGLCRDIPGVDLHPIEAYAKWRERNAGDKTFYLGKSADKRS